MELSWIDKKSLQPFIYVLWCDFVHLGRSQLSSRYYETICWVIFLTVLLEVSSVLNNILTFEVLNMMD